MEKEQTTTHLKARSYRSVLKTGIRYYNEQFRTFFKASWLTALILALCFGAAGTLALQTLPDTPVPIALLAAMPIALPIVYVMARRLLKRQRTFWHTTDGSPALYLRHGGIIVGVLLTSLLLVALASCVILLPATILCLANQQALQGVLYGDPVGMPRYMPFLTLATLTLTTFTMFYISQILIVHNFFACGAVVAKEQDRLNIKQQAS
jgi:hypothetical protein